VDALECPVLLLEPVSQRPDLRTHPPIPVRRIDVFGLLAYPAQFLKGQVKSLLVRPVVFLD
jgi:hypothetical protein